MDSIIKDKNITPDEKLAATLRATEVMIEYMGTQKSFQKKMDTGVRYLTWMLALGLVMSVLFIASQFYQRYSDNNFTAREKLLSNREKLFVERVRQQDFRDSSMAHDLTVRRADLIKMQTNLNKRDSILKLVASKTINTNVVNTKSLNIKK